MLNLLIKSINCSFRSKLNGQKDFWEIFKWTFDFSGIFWIKLWWSTSYHIWCWIWSHRFKTSQKTIINDLKNNCKDFSVNEIVIAYIYNSMRKEGLFPSLINQKEKPLNYSSKLTVERTNVEWLMSWVKNHKLCHHPSVHRWNTFDTLNSVW